MIRGGCGSEFPNPTAGWDTMYSIVMGVSSPARGCRRALRCRGRSSFGAASFTALLRTDLGFRGLFGTGLRDWSGPLERGADLLSRVITEDTKGAEVAEWGIAV